MIEFNNIAAVIRPQLRMIILDRDGVINYDSDAYIKRPEEWNALPGSLEAICKLQQHFHVCVATNQSGLGRGLFDLDALNAIHARMQEEISALGGKPVPIFFCPHTPEAKCSCRKPLPGLVTAALEHFDQRAEEALMVGDANRAIEAGLAAGCHTVMVGDGASAPADTPRARDLSEVTQALTSF